MAPGMMVIFCAVVVAVIVAIVAATWAIGFAGCMITIVFGIWKRSRSVACVGCAWLIAWCCTAMVCSGMVLCVVFQHDILPFSAQARSYIQLPDEAQVLSVEHGDWAGDGVVFFRLPPTRPDAEWFEAVWSTNMPAAGFDEARFADGRHQRAVRGVGIAMRELHFDPATRIYRFRVMLDS